MTGVYKGCPRCRNLTGHGPIGDAECALWDAIKQDVQALTVTLDNPPTATQVDDLLAHLNTRYADKSRAHAAAVIVLQLGWRPSAGVAS